MPVPAAAVRIHASCNPGAVVRISGGPLAGGLRELWTGTGPAEAVQTIAVTPAVQIQRLRLELDTSKVPGWNQIDAVAPVDADGAGHWATAATASSTWGHPRVPAPAP